MGFAVNEMIERVALAISGSDDPASILTIHRIRARLAIGAMREVPKEITARVAANQDLLRWEIAPIWEAVIDEALRDE
jgi:hypothetical protein